MSFAKTIAISRPTDLKMMMEIATTVYANSTPIDSMLTKACRSNRAENRLVRRDAHSVPVTGVWKRREITPNSWNIRPSCAIAYLA